MFSILVHFLPSACSCRFPMLPSALSPARCAAAGLWQSCVLHSERNLSFFPPCSFPDPPASAPAPAPGRQSILLSALTGSVALCSPFLLCLLSFLLPLDQPLVPSSTTHLFPADQPGFPAGLQESWKGTLLRARSDRTRRTGLKLRIGLDGILKRNSSLRGQ